MAIEFKNEYGLISISSKLISEIAANEAESCYGVVGMASRSAANGLVNLLKGDNKGRGVKVTSQDNKAIVELHIVVEFGININSICKSIANRVRYTLESVAGVPVKSVNIRVEGIRVSE